MAYNFGYNTNPYYTGYNPQIQQPQPQQTAPQPQVQSGFICRPVTSREEALATPCDFMAAGVIMPDMAHGMIYLKRFNSQTGAIMTGASVRATANVGKSTTSLPVRTRTSGRRK